MTGELDAWSFDLQLARELSCTVAEMHDRISSQEYLIRRARAVYDAAQRQLEAKAAAAKGKHG